MASSFDVASARSHFPALQQQAQIYMDNAGGSQILGNVAESIREYLCRTNVQLGASYEISRASTTACTKGFEAGAKYINAGPDEIVFGPSTTQLFRNLSVALRPHFPPGSEIVISGLDHEANIAAWLTMAEDLGVAVKWWQPRTPSPSNPHLTPESLAPLLNDKTRMVACTHASNILGSITDVRAIADLLHRECPGALLCVDAVAYAPHRPLDVRAFGVDVYAFSWYKVYGPHIAQLYVKKEVQDRCMRTLGHYFKPSNTLEDKLGLAGASYELVQSLPLVCEYAAQPGFWPASIAHEEAMQEVMLAYLRSKPEKYTIYGVPDKDAALRVPVVSFVVHGRNSGEVVDKIQARSRYAFRSGHFYSKRLVNEVMGLDDNGVVRMSLCHYNTVEEVQGLVQELDRDASA